MFFTLNREDFSFVIHLDRQPRTSRRREAQTGSRARSGSRSERTLDAVEHSRTLMEWWPFLIFHRGGLRIKVINNSSLQPLAATLHRATPRSRRVSSPEQQQCSYRRWHDGRARALLRGALRPVDRHFRSDRRARRAPHGDLRHRRPRRRGHPSPRWHKRRERHPSDRRALRLRHCQNGQRRLCPRADRNDHGHRLEAERRGHPESP